MRIKLCHKFEDIISIENFLEAWREFLKGKRSKRDVQEFNLTLMDNILSLHQDLSNLTYKHQGYKAFNIRDPKPRNIHKAVVRDRLLHHAIYRQLYPFFDKIFIADSYSCRVNKGTHKAISRFRSFARQVSSNHTKTCWVLKGDISKFFASIDHAALINILNQYIPDQKILWLLTEVISSFETKPKTGLPLGNLTSQLLVNIYMNEFDQFVKHKIKAKHYIRYADDFVLLSQNRDWLEKQIPLIGNFLNKKLKLSLHPYKVFIKTIASGVDFLGWTHFADHRTLRSATKRRMMRRVKANSKPQTITSYFGLLKHGNTHKLQADVFKTHLLSESNIVLN